MDGVDVWYVFSDEVRDPRILARYAAIITPEERVRHDRFVFPRDRHQFLVTRGVLRTLIGQYLQIDPAGCVFESNRYGRPSLAGPAAATLGFNLSHTNGLVAYAIAGVPEIGIDVEHVERATDSLNLARRFFSPSEADALDALPLSERPSRFFDYWTLKEAYIKARGLGLSLPLDGFSMQLDAGGPPRIRFAASIYTDQDSWQYAQCNPSPRHRLAVAVRRHGRDLAIRVREIVPCV
jgi:4'-phosphopantetheinyl transferase